MNEKCTDTGCIACRIQLGVVAIRLVVAAEKCFAFAPTAAADDLVSGCRAEGRRASRSPVFDNEIRFIANKLSIYAKDGTERGFYLLFGIIRRSQSAGGERN